MSRHFSPDFCRSPAPTIGLEDYPHLASETDLARRLLLAALRERTRGVNLLFYGPTGTGKTELSRALAKTLGASLYMAGAADRSGESAPPRERLGSLLVGNRLLAGTEALLLFDEAEDLFQRDGLFGFGARRRRDELQASKQWFNLLLETNRVPTLWIANDIRGMDPALLRRFAYAIEFPSLGPGGRRRLWQRHLDKTDRVSEEEVEHLAEGYEVNAAQIGAAVSLARLVTGEGADRPHLEALLSPGERLLTGRRRTRASRRERSSYRLDCVSASADLERVADAISGFRASGEGLSLCLYGPPGTGKSAFVHHLARRSGLRVRSRRVSDIESCWVGETEKNIAAAFREAETEGALLLFDEADSFLRDRRHARARWEVSAANEFLHALEDFGGVVACTTNLFEELDRASLRRLTFKIEFDYLGADQAAALFEELLAPLLPEPLGGPERAEVRRKLAPLRNLAPGDFAVVRRRFRAMGGEASLEELLEELCAECRAKEASSRRAGFFA